MNEVYSSTIFVLIDGCTGWGLTIIIIIEWTIDSMTSFKSELTNYDAINSIIRLLCGDKPNTSST